LRSGKIAGAGLDVLLGEADQSARAVADELLSLPNVLASPHVAGASREGLARANLLAAKSIVAIFNGGLPASQYVVANGLRGRKAE
jgi:D-3-phosphoglycerate dehydrogenase